MTDIDPWASEYSCISADPPWEEHGGGKCKRGADRWYPLMKKEEIARVMVSAPCWRLAESCHLWLWVTNNHLEDGLWVMKEVGFRYVTNRCWAKMTCTEDLNQFWMKQRHGLGQYMWGEHELLLLGVRGPTMLPPSEGRPGTLLLAPRTREHSEKPEQAYRDMERVSHSVGPRLEMFAAGAPRAGWDKWMPMVHR